MSAEDSARIRQTRLEDAVFERERAAVERLIRLADAIALADGIASGAPSPIAHVSAALRLEAPPLPMDLVPRRENLRAGMLATMPAAPDEPTLEAVLRLVGQLADGLAHARAGLGELPQRLADLVSASLIPFTPEAHR